LEITLFSSYPTDMLAIKPFLRARALTLSQVHDTCAHNVTTCANDRRWKLHAITHFAKP